jgi:hypothetical protein
MENVKNNVFGITRRSIDALMNIVSSSSVAQQNEQELISYVKNEYQDDWQWALSYYKDNKSFPSNYIKY